MADQNDSTVVLIGVGRTHLGRAQTVTGSNPTQLSPLSLIPHARARPLVPLLLLMRADAAAAASLRSGHCRPALAPLRPGVSSLSSPPPFPCRHGANLTSCAPNRDPSWNPSHMVRARQRDSPLPRLLPCSRSVHGRLFKFLLDHSLNLASSPMLSTSSSTSAGWQ